MARRIDILKRLVRDLRAEAVVEYAVVFGLMAVGILSAMQPSEAPSVDVRPAAVAEPASQT